MKFNKGDKVWWSDPGADFDEDCSGEAIFVEYDPDHVVIEKDGCLMECYASELDLIK